MGSSSTGSTRSVSFISQWISAIALARISTLLSSEHNLRQIRQASKRTSRRMCTTIQLMPLKTANTTTTPRNSRRSTNPSPRPNHSPFNRLPLESKTLRLPYSKTASSQRLPRKSTFRLRRASKPTKPSLFLELMLARWRAPAINHQVLTLALPSLDKRTQRKGEWRVRRLVRGYLELPCVRCAEEFQTGDEEREGSVLQMSLADLRFYSLFSIYSLVYLGWIICLGRRCYSGGYLACC